MNMDIVLMKYIRGTESGRNFEVENGLTCIKTEGVKM